VIDGECGVKAKEHCVAIWGAFSDHVGPKVASSASSIFDHKNLFQALLHRFGQGACNDVNWATRWETVNEFHGLRGKILCPTQADNQRAQTNEAKK
jgi:hypothetical protein